MNDKKELLDTANKICRTIQQPLFECKVDDTRPARMAGNLCLTILELHIGVTALLNSYAETHAPILLRAMQESLASLTCLNLDLNYINQIYLDDADQNIKMIEGFLKVMPPAEQPNVNTYWNPLLDGERQTIETHIDKGLKCQKIYERFKMAGMLENYESTYRFLCSFAHNNATTLHSRHGAVGELKFADPFPLETFRMCLKISLITLKDAVNLMPKFTDIDEVELNKLYEIIEPEFLKLG